MPQTWSGQGYFLKSRFISAVIVAGLLENALDVFLLYIFPLASCETWGIFLSYSQGSCESCGWSRRHFHTHTSPFLVGGGGGGVAGGPSAPSPSPTFGHLKVLIIIPENLWFSLRTYPLRSQNHGIFTMLEYVPHLSLRSASCETWDRVILGYSHTETSSANKIILVALTICSLFELNPRASRKRTWRISSYLPLASCETRGCVILGYSQIVTEHSSTNKIISYYSCCLEDIPFLNSIPGLLENALDVFVRQLVFS